MNEFERIAAEPFKPHQCMHWSDGRRCRAYAIHNEYFCVRHRIDPIVNIVPSEPFALPPFLTDRAQIQAALGEVLTRLAAKTIDDKRARLLLYSLQNAISNLKAPNRRLPHTLDATTLRRRRRRTLPRWQPQPALTEPPQTDAPFVTASSSRVGNGVTDAVIPSEAANPAEPASEIGPGFSPDNRIQHANCRDPKPCGASSPAN
ncbi:MAG TPA: hypothetical protein VII58_12815 [Acidobacteriaceae bacterium]